MKNKYDIGDKVKVINYGSLAVCPKNGTMFTSLPSYFEDDKKRYVDIRPHDIGKEGLICEVSFVQGKYSYGVTNIGWWYNEDQLELVSKNNNNQ